MNSKFYLLAMMKQMRVFIFLSLLLIHAGCEKPAGPELNPDFIMISSNEFRAPTEVTFIPLDDFENAVYSWKFDDGTKSNDPNPKKFYITGGARSITLEVHVDGKVKIKSKTLTIAPNCTKPSLIHKKPEFGQIVL